MKTKTHDLHETPQLPQARTTRKGLFGWIWIVPIVTGLVAAWLVYQNVRKAGPTITIHFEDGKGIQPGQTVVRYRGVRVGEVRSVELEKDMKSVRVVARLDTSAENLAREGASFWIVKADVSGGTVSGLDTLMGGPYIGVKPGSGAPKKSFEGLKQGPLVTIQEPGLDITLTWPELGWLNPGAPLYYRGVEVGIVRDYSLGAQATNILIHVHVHERFAPLVRQNSRFWNAGGIKADISLFGGVSVSAETLKSLLVGGIAFATPSPPGPPPLRQQVFPLYDKPENKWLKWSPEIDIGPPTDGSQPEDGRVNLQQLTPGKAGGVPK